MFLHAYEASTRLLRTIKLLTQLTAQTPPVSRLLSLKFLHYFPYLWWMRSKLSSPCVYRASNPADWFRALGRYDLISEPEQAIYLEKSPDDPPVFCSKTRSVISIVLSMLLHMS